MSDLGVGAVNNSGSGVSTMLAAPNDPPHSSVGEFMQAMAVAHNRSAAEQSASGGANTAPADQTKAPNDEGGGSWLDRSLGMLQAGVGVIEVVGGVVGGVLTSETGVGAVAGGAVALHGLDDIQAGARQAWTGKPTETVTQQVVTSAAQHVGAPPAIAAGIGIGVDIVASGGVGGAEKAAVKTTEAVVKTTEAAVKTTEAAVKTTEAAVKTTEAAVKGTEATVKGTEATGKAVEDTAKLSKDGAQAERVVKDGKAVAGTSETAGKAAHAAQPGKADLDAFWGRLKVSPNQNDTIAIGKFDDVPALKDKTLEGVSPGLRQRVGRPDLDATYGADRIKSPNPSPRFSGHAEEEVVDAADANIKDAGLKPADLDGKTLNIHISKETGVCNNCAAGLPENSRATLGAGPLKQLSEKYPGLTIRVTAEGANAYAGREVLEIRNGKIIN
jgi:hypothetical protein